MSLKARENKRKYLKAPTPIQLQEFIDELGANYAQFEQFYGIPKNTIYQIIKGKRDLPAKFWDIVYDRKKPAYGVGFLTTGGVPVIQTKKQTKIVLPRRVTHNPLLDVVRKKEGL